jgi:uncharacterized membrane protein YiaA
MLDQHRKWRDELVYHLRMADVPGDRIGDILLEVESHIAETREEPGDTFGSPKEYAKSRAGVLPSKPDEEHEDLGVLMIALFAFVGSFTFVSGALAAGRGEESVYFLNPWIVTVIGAGILAFGLVNLPVDFVRHPISDKPLVNDYTYFKWIAAGVIVLVGVIFYLLGRVLA